LNATVCIQFRLDLDGTVCKQWYVHKVTYMCSFFIIEEQIVSYDSDINVTLKILIACTQKFVQNWLT